MTRVLQAQWDSQELVDHKDKLAIQASRVRLVQEESRGQPALLDHQVRQVHRVLVVRMDSLVPLVNVVWLDHKEASVHRARKV